MDPTDNLMPGAEPVLPIPPAPAPELAPTEPVVAPLEPVAPTVPVAPAPEPLAAPVADATAPAADTINPAATIADAAMAGAAPVVATTDLDAATAPAAADAAEAGPVNLAPSADFQVGETSTVSAAPNESETLVGTPVETESNPMDAVTGGTEEQPQTGEMQGPGAADFTNEGEPTETTNQEEITDEPLEAAEPVPGSIGSAKSYADIQREEAERAARMAQKQNSKIKFGKTQIMIIAIAAIAVIAIGVAAFVMMSGNKKTTPKNNTPVAPVEPVETQLSCKKSMAQDDFAVFGAVSGTQENIFIFSDDELSGLATNLNYKFSDVAMLNLRKTEWMNYYGLKDEPEEETDEEEDDEGNSEAEEPATNAKAKDQISGKKTVEEMLKHKVTAKDLVLTHRMEVGSEDIEAWLKSEAYSDENYGAKVETEINDDGEEEPVEVTRNLEFYQKAQNSIGYSCSVVE